jgi:hypothetical protein
MMASVAIVIDSAKNYVKRNSFRSHQLWIDICSWKLRKRTEFCNVDRDIATFPHMPRINDMFVVSVEDTGNMITVFVFLTWGVWSRAFWNPISLHHPSDHLLVNVNRAIKHFFMALPFFKAQELCSCKTWIDFLGQFQV